MEAPCRVLIVDDEPEIREILRRCLEALPDLECLEAGSGREAIALARRTCPRLIILDVRLPDMHGLEVLRAVRQFDPTTRVVMLTAFDDSQIAVQAMQQGAEDYLTKPIDVDRFLDRIRHLLESARIRSTLPSTVDEIPPVADEQVVQQLGLLGRSAAMRRLFQWIVRIAGVDSPVLITGQSGTGKRRVAEVIHRLSPRRDAPFVVVDCGTLPTPLLESELFGHEKGAFTGATQQKQGRFELAAGGTLLLDEIGNLPPEGQMKLLQFLEEHIIYRLGATRPIHLDVRILAASNRDLYAMVRAGQFREDLFFRLNVFHIEIPPLQDRVEDIPLLAEYFLQRLNEKYGRNVRGFRPEAMAALMRYSWPGNVRELRNVVERCVVLADRWIGPEHLPDPVRQCVLRVSTDDADTGNFTDRARHILAAVERALLLEALDRAGGNKRRAAELLGISLRTLYYKMEKYLEKGG